MDKKALERVIHLAYPDKRHLYATAPPHVTRAVKLADQEVPEDFFQAASKVAQRSPKFFFTPSKEITESEAAAIFKVSDVALPYQEIVLQTKTTLSSLQTLTCTLLCRESDTVWDHPNYDVGDMRKWKPKCAETFEVVMFTDTQANKAYPDNPQQWWTHLDTIVYEFQFLTCNTANPDYTIKNNDYGTWRWRIGASQLAVDDSVTESGDYTNESLNLWANMIGETLSHLSIALAYPAITRTTKVAGCKPMIKPPMKNFRASSFLKRPVWEHTTLEVDLYTDTSVETDARNIRVPKRMHGVRKHLRKLKSGKLTWVKAHTRGNKRLGAITKDYDLHT